MASWRKLTFLSQLSIMVTVGVACVALFSSIVISWQSGQQIRGTLVEQGVRTAEALASSSNLALLYVASENVDETVAATLAFPGVIEVSIHDVGGRPIVAKARTGKADTNHRLPVPVRPAMDEETDSAWVFVAPVRTKAAMAPFDLGEKRAAALGFVRIVQSKDTLKHMVRNVFLANLVISFFFAALFLISIRALASRLTRPLTGLAQAMKRAEEGEANVRAEVSGSKDILVMVSAFNRMIVGLQRAGELALAKERAEHANRAKTAFLARMSHELRTPLNAIMGYAQILRLSPGQPQRHLVGLNAIHSSGDHLLMLINDILDLSKIEAGKIELRPRRLELRSFLQGISDIVRIKAEEKDLSFVLNVDECLPPAITVDDSRLRQILLNLLSNAVKFTSEGRVGLSASCTPVPEGQALLRFEVRDTGVGIAAEDASRIFEPFEQAGEARGRDAGTGLGLTISQHLVRLMGNDITLESAPGMGSTFAFELLVPLAEAGSLNPVTERLRINGYAGARRTLLIADDVAGNRAMLRDLLTPMGFLTIEAVDGQDAIEKISEANPDLVLMDMSMPVLDGLDTTRRIRANEQWEALPVIAVSANASEDDRAQCLEAGSTAFVSKPIDRDRLLQIIGELLDLEWETEPTQTVARNEPRSDPVPRALVQEATALPESDRAGSEQSA